MTAASVGSIVSYFDGGWRVQGRVVATPEIDNAVRFTPSEGTSQVLIIETPDGQLTMRLPHQIYLMR